MFVTAQEVIDYSVIPTVKKRSPEHLKFDIMQAEADVFSYVGHNFGIPPYLDPTGVITLPDIVSLTIIKLAEYYAVNNSDQNILRGYESERISEYQYTLKSSSNGVSNINLDSLLSSFRIATPNNKGSVRLRLGAF